MGTMKRFTKYVIFLILFWFLSDFLIKIAIDSTYKNIQQKGEFPNGIEVIQMQATAVNGRMKLKVSGEEFTGKFLKIDLYSRTDVNLGTQYIELGTIRENQIKDYETYFKISGVESYEISVVEEKGESSEGFMDTALSILTVIGIVIKLLAL